MRKIYTFVICCILLTANILSAQNVAVSTGFDNYAGTIATAPYGWYLSWNTSNSFYTSTLNYGLSSPSYKFGNDSDFVVAPGYPMIDSVSFFVRGNGTPFSPQNELQIWTSNDSTNWTLSTYLDNLPTTGTTMTVPLPTGTPYVKFVYRKATAGGNLAFDDVKLYSNAVIGAPEINPAESIRVYPTPTTGNISISSPATASSKLSIQIFDLLGNKIPVAVRKLKNGLYSADLSAQRQGFYFVRIQGETFTVTKRISLVSEN